MKNLFTIILVFAATVMYAQFTLDGEIRPRTEINHGLKSPVMENQNMSVLTSQRTRLGFGYKSDLFDVGIQIQDVRAWGSQKQLVSNDGALTTIHQAWASIQLCEMVALKVGRQELVYDDSRILGNVGWAQQARSHDIALFKIEKKDAFKLHAGFAVNSVQTEMYNVANYKSMQFLWFNKKFGDAYTLSVLALNNGVNDTTFNSKGNTTTFSQIVGQRSVYKAGALKVGLNIYYQMGKAAAGYMDNSGDYQKKAIGAYNLGLDIDYKLNDHFNVGVGYEMLSGNSQTEDASYYETNHAFTPLYGTNHKFNGWMDYFYVGNHGNNVGLNDAFVKIGYKNGKFLTGAHVHYFMANADVLDQKEFVKTGEAKAMSAGLGTEIDYYAGYKLGKGVLLKAGVSMMMATETLHAVKTTNFDMAGVNYWGWAMIVVKPNFFKSEK